MYVINNVLKPWPTEVTTKSSFSITKPEKDEEDRAKNKRPTRAVRSSNQSERKPFPAPPDTDEKDTHMEGTYFFFKTQTNIVPNLGRNTTTWLKRMSSNYVYKLNGLYAPAE